MSSSQIDPISQVAAAILANDRIGHAAIVVDGTEGMITLRGTVETEQDKFIAEALAQEQDGGVEVDNKLRITGL